MAVKRQPLPNLQDENAKIHRGKSAAAKAQQTDQCDRKTLSNITNRRKPSTDGLRAGVENTGAKKGRAVPRDPLRDISNIDLSQSSKTSEASGKRKNLDQGAENAKFGPTLYEYRLTEEMEQEIEQKAAMWALEGIERAHFTGEDMEALRAKMQEEEFNKDFRQQFSHRTDHDLPCSLPSVCACEEDPADDILEFDVEDGFRFHHDEELWMPVADYEDYLPGCIERLQNVSIDWSVLEDCTV